MGVKVVTRPGIAHNAFFYSIFNLSPVYVLSLASVQVEKLNNVSM